jgi:hypothetical protein
MAVIDRIFNIIQTKGAAMRSDDLRDIEVMVAEMPTESTHEQEPFILEAISLIVNDPDYSGDIAPI